MNTTTILRVIGICLVLGVNSSQAAADDLVFSDSDFTTIPVFSTVETFSFTIDLNVILSPGTAYTNTALNNVKYNVRGALVPGTPSGFSGFNLVRDITGAEFYAQGSSLRFEIAGSADLSDGLQVSEFAGTDVVFEFNGREIDNGRFHPALFQLRANGTGRIQNSNNVPFGTEIAMGSEYITDLTFDPASLTLVENPTIPEPATVALLAMSSLAVMRRRKE